MPKKREIMADAIKLAREWMPDQAHVPMMPMDEAAKSIPSQTGHKRFADASPNGIRYDAEALNDIGDPQWTANLLVHELTHMKQPPVKTKSLWERAYGWLTGTQEPSFPYGQDPAELEAFSAANDRALATHSHPVVAPSFWGGPKRFTDVNLPPDKPKRRSPK